MTRISPKDLVTQTRTHLNQYISQADQKASILLTAQITFLGLFANAMKTLTIQSAVIRWMAIASAGFAVIGIFLSGWAVYPRTPGPEKGVTYWGNIAQHDDEHDFKQAIDRVGNKEETDAETHLVHQNYFLAEVAEEKYLWLRWSLRVTTVTVFCAVIAGAAYLFG